MRSLLALALLLPAVVFAGPIYRWVDGSGQVHYGETPPAGVSAQAQGKLKAKAGAISATPAVSVAAAAPAVSRPGKAIAAVTPPDAAKVASQKEIKARNCEAARAHIEMLQTKTARRILIPQKDGSTSRMTDEEFEKSLADAQKTAASNCS